MTEELPPFLFPIDIVVNELKIPIEISFKVRNFLKPVIFDFNRTLRSPKGKIENISYYLIGRPERFIDVNIMITGKFANTAEEANSIIKEKAYLIIILLLEHNSLLTAARDSEFFDTLIEKLKCAPNGISHTEIKDSNFVAAGSLIGKNCKLTES